MPFHRVKTTNNWEYLTYHLLRRKLDEEKGGRADVRWPDGSVTSNVEFVSVSKYAFYHDHGKRTDLRQRKLMLCISLNGLDLKIPIQDIEVANVTQPVSP